VREYASPPLDEPPSGTLTDDLVRREDAEPDAVACRVRAGDGWSPVSVDELVTQVRAVAKGLVAAGIEPGERVALLSSTRYEWTVLDYAIWWAGAVGVPVYETSSASQVGWILGDSGAAAVVVETAAHAARVAEVRADLDDLRHVWSLDGNAVDVLTRLGGDISDEELERRRQARGAGDLATLIYTSGTTGRPKGCELTHANLLAEVAAAIAALPDLFPATDGEGTEAEDPASTLLFLPLAHVFARVIQVGCLRAGVELGHSSDISRLVEDLGTFRPTFLLAVPRVFEKVFTSASQRAAADGRGGVFDRATSVALAWSRSEDASPGRWGRRTPWLRAQKALFDRLVHRRLREALGGRCRYAVSGGAPLGERLAHFYRGIGVTVLEGYGLTETTAAVTVNRPDALKIGTVGQPLPGTHVRVADDGELLFAGPQVFGGYWNRPDATAEAIDTDGWFHTGDLGEIDDEGFVRITGRKKEILVTAGGKNVAPAVLEDLVRAHPLVSQVLVVGDGRPFIGALVTLDAESLAVWAQERSLPTDPVALARHDALVAEVQSAVDTANEAVSRAESIRAFRVLAADWTEEGDQLTPSLKLKRHVLLRQFRSEIEDLYL